jgi:ankyrin repeat protein
MCSFLLFALLFIALQKGHLLIVNQLLAADADVGKARTSDGATPLFMVAEKGDLCVVAQLIAAGADVDKARTSDSCTPLFFAAQKGNTETVALLLKSGADKSLRGFANRTPLEQAQRFGHAPVIALLRFGHAALKSRMLSPRIERKLSARRAEKEVSS